EQLNSPEAIRSYFRSYFFERAAEMTYPVEPKPDTPIAAKTTLWDLHALNPLGVAEFKRIHSGNSCPLRFRQALSSASQTFRVIDAPTQGIIVPYRRPGLAIIAELASAFVSEGFPLSKQIE